MKKLLALGIFVALLLAWFFLADAGSDEVRLVDPVSASLSDNGSILSVQVPHVGGCARRTHDVYYDVEGSSLVVWVEAVGEGEFSCLAGCLEPGCTEELTLRLDEPVDPATPIVFRNPGPGIFGGAIIVIAGLMAAVAFVVFIMPLLGSGRRPSRSEFELPPYEPDGE
jgi:hypothetical protein